MLSLLFLFHSSLFVVLSSVLLGLDLMIIGMPLNDEQQNRKIYYRYISKRVCDDDKDLIH